jgi:RNA polymerase sigma factor (sigma-70 family)
MMGLLPLRKADVEGSRADGLLARARLGDPDAFEALLEDHYDLIYRTAWKWCGSRDDAEDVAQDVCMKLGQAIAGFDGRSAFSSWLYRITLNAVRDLQRVRSRQKRHVDAFSEVAPDTQLPEQEDAAATSELWGAVRRLPDRQRDAVLLVYAEELSHAEAAEIMGIGEATVSFHVHAARKTLRGLL